MSEEDINQENINDMMKKERTEQIRKELDRLIEQDMDVTMAVKRASEEFIKWKTHELTLVNSNEKLRLELKGLETERAYLREQIAIKSESHQKLDEEFKKLEEFNKEEDRKFLEYFDAEVSKYRSLFTNAEKEYNTASLSADIENDQKSLLELGEEIKKIDEEIEELKAKDNLSTKETTDSLMELKQLQKILIDDDKLLILLIRSSENKLKEIENKIRQKQREVKNISEKIPKK